MTRTLNYRRNSSPSDNPADPGKQKISEKPNPPGKTQQCLKNTAPGSNVLDSAEYSQPGLENEAKLKSRPEPLKEQITTTNADSGIQDSTTPPKLEDEFYLNIRSVKKHFRVIVEENDSVRDVRKKAAERTGYSVGQIHLFHGKEHLNPARSISYYFISSGSTLHLFKARKATKQRAPHNFPVPEIKHIENSIIFNVNLRNLSQATGHRSPVSLFSFPVGNLAGMSGEISDTETDEEGSNSFGSWTDKVSVSPTATESSVVSLKDEEGGIIVEHVELADSNKPRLDDALEKIETLRLENQDAQKEIETLKVEKETLQEKAETLEEKAAALIGRVDALEEEKQELAQSNLKLQGEWRGLMEDEFGQEEMVIRDVIQADTKVNLAAP